MVMGMMIIISTHSIPIRHPWNKATVPLPLPLVHVCSRRIFQEDVVGVGQHNAMGVMMIRHGGKVGCDSNEDYDTNNYCGGGGIVGRRIVWKQYVAVHQHHQPWRHSQQPDPPRPGIQPGIDIVWKNNCFVSFIRLNSHSSSIIVVVVGFLQDIIKCVWQQHD